MGVACLGQWYVNSRNYFNEIFKNSNSRKFRPAKFLRYTVSWLQFDSINTLLLCSNKTVDNSCLNVTKEELYPGKWNVLIRKKIIRRREWLWCHGGREQKALQNKLLINSVKVRTIQPPTQNYPFAGLFHISVAIHESFICKNQPRIGFRHHDMLGNPTWQDLQQTMCLSTKYCTDGGWFPVHWFKSSWSSIDGNTCFDRHGCQQGDENGTAGRRTLLTSKHGAYVQNTSLPRRRRRYSSKRAGNLKLWDFST